MSFHGTRKGPFDETRRVPMGRSPRQADLRLANSSRFQSLTAGPHAGHL
jgi:hypothetical protein